MKQPIKKAILLTDTEFDNLICGHCKSVLYGYDEVICPCCGGRNNFDHMQEMTEEEFYANNQ
jgi:hypothetical protein